MTNAEIRAGEYVRTHKGIIAKVLAYEDLRVYRDGEEGVVFHSFDTDNGSIANVDIKSHSTNLLDLIEVKDILRIIMCDAEDIDKENPYETLWHIDTSYTLNNITTLIKANEVSLLGIVTHQQFENIEYKAGGEDDQQR